MIQTTDVTLDMLRQVSEHIERDMDGTSPFQMWRETVDTAPTMDLRRLAVLAWGNWYASKIGAMVVQGMAGGDLTETPYETVARTLQEVWARLDKPTADDTAADALINYIILGATHRLLGQILTGGMLMGHGPQGEAPDCGDPSCPGHPVARGQEATMATVIPTSAMDGMITVSNDRAGTGLYL